MSLQLRAPGKTVPVNFVDPAGTNAFNPDPTSIYCTGVYVDGVYWGCLSGTGNGSGTYGDIGNPIDGKDAFNRPMADTPAKPPGFLIRGSIEPPPIRRRRNRMLTRYITIVSSRLQKERLRDYLDF